jgi:hypothetical protein
MTPQSYDAPPLTNAIAQLNQQPFLQRDGFFFHHRFKPARLNLHDAALVFEAASVYSSE